MIQRILAFVAMLAPIPAMAAPALRLDSVITLHMDDARFGGFSSLEVAEDGLSFVSTSDRGALLRGQILRENGRLAGVENLVLSDVPDSKGRPLSGHNSDAEGLAISPEGRVYMSFEGNHRVMVQNSFESLPEFVPKHPDFRNLINNSGLEALAISDEGTLFAIPERSGALDRPYPVYRLQNGAWDKSWTIPRLGDYLVTGADIFEGRLYVLERSFSPFSGFSSRIRRFEIGAATGEILLETTSWTLDNMEGIALWRPLNGAVRVVLISDDNFVVLQRTQLAEFVLRE